MNGKILADKMIENMGKVIVGKEETVGVMVENVRKNRRYSGLKLRLQGKCE